MKLIGLTGMPKSGKGEIVNVLTGIGWTHVSMSSVYFQHVLAENPGLQVTRSDMRNRARLYREINGGGAFADLCMRHLQTMPEEMLHRVVIDGIRHPDEIETILRHHPDAYILGVVASTDPVRDAEIRFSRLLANPQQRGAQFEEPTWEAFREADQLEWDDPTSERGIKIGRCLDTVAALQQTGRGFILQNDEHTTLAEWGERVREHVKRFDEGGRHPERQ